MYLEVINYINTAKQMLSNLMLKGKDRDCSVFFFIMKTFQKFIHFKDKRFRLSGGGFFFITHMMDVMQ